MPDKEFETKIRDSLKALNLEPSPQVWKAVSGRIRTGKRRSILFWLPLVVLLVGMGWWSIWYSRQEALARKTAWAEMLKGDVDRRTADSLQRVAQSTGLPREAAQSGGLPREAAQPGGLPREAAQSGGLPREAAQPGGFPREAAQPGGLPQEAAPSAGSHRGAAPSPGAGAYKAGNSRGGNAESGNSLTGWTLRIHSADLPPDLYAFNPLDAVPGRIVPVFPVSERAATTKDSLEKPGDSSKKPGGRSAWRKWQSRAYAGVGISGQGRFSRFSTPMGSPSGLMLPASLYSTSGNTSNTAGSGSGAYTTAARRPGPGLEAGFEEQYRFARHWKIQAGLEYAYWETAFASVVNTGVYAGMTNPATIATGYNGSSDGIYVASSTGQTYVNRYSLLQLPVGISWLMAPKRRWNPSLYTGISLGYLSGRHVLQYTPDSIAYRTGPPDLLRHWSVYWEVGFDMDVYHWGTNLLYLGPVIQYGLSGLQTQGAVKDHLNYAGLRLGMGFR